MSGSGKVLLALSGCLLVSTVVAQGSAAQGSAAQGTNATAASQAAAATGPATKTMVENACSECHEFTRVSSQHKSADQWETIVNQMISMGAPLSDAEAPRVVAYLAKNYGPVGTGKAANR